jgi:hypothetical protein
MPDPAVAGRAALPIPATLPIPAAALAIPATLPSRAGLPSRAWAPACGLIAPVVRTPTATRAAPIVRNLPVAWTARVVIAPAAI